MADYFSISNLLSLLQTDHHSTAMKLCRQAESLRRRRHYAEAIRVTESAADMVQDNFSLLGVVLLYMSYARLSSHLPREEARAIRDCDRATRLLSLTPFNHAIAYVIRAQIEIRHKTRGERRTALSYFDRADKVLQDLIATEREYNRLDQVELVTKLRQEIDDISQKIVEVQPVEPATPRGTPEPPEPEAGPSVSTLKPAAPPVPGDTPGDLWTEGADPEEPPSPSVVTAQFESTPTMQDITAIKLPIPTLLAWPFTNSSAGFQLSSLDSDLAPDYLEATYLMIDEQLFRIRPVALGLDTSRRFRVELRKRYLIMKLLDTQHAHYAIVRTQDRPDRARQFVAVDDTKRHTAWIDDAEFTAPFEHIHIIGGDQKISLVRKSRPYIEQPRIIGVVEALLTRVTPERERVYASI